MNIYSYNLNGIKSDLRGWIERTWPDALCLQAIRAHPNAVDFPLRHLRGYHTYWAPAENPTDGGVALYTQDEPLRVQLGTGAARYDIEGRTMIAFFEDFTLVNAYAPGGTNGREAWYYKMAYLHQLLETVANLRSQPMVLCASIYIGHTEQDLARPILVAGFMPEERDWITELLDLGFQDTYRRFHPDEQAFTWRTGRSAGWRVDYIFTNFDVESASIHPATELSPHHPISVSF